MGVGNCGLGFGIVYLVNDSQEIQSNNCTVYRMPALWTRICGQTHGDKYVKNVAAMEMVLTNNDKTNRPSGRFLNYTCLNYSPIYDKISVQRKGTKMAKINDFKDALELMQDGRGYFVNSSDFSVAGNMDKWLCVHATNYMPRRDRNGNVYIPTTGMATGYKYARATVHFTLNQIVSSHMGGNWDASPIVVLAPYNDIVAKNGNPRMVASEDTFFIPNPDTGLILPETTHIIRPDNGRLFNIGEHVSTYKTDKFTDQEIETILSLVPLSSRQEYEKYANEDDGILYVVYAEEQFGG